VDFCLWTGVHCWKKSSSSSISKSGNDLFATKSASNPAFAGFGAAIQVLPPSSCFGATSRDAKLSVHVSSGLWRLP
jgi:hypothetical protein